MKDFGIRFTHYAWVTLAPLTLAGADYDDAAQSTYTDGWERLEDGSTEVNGLGGWVFEENNIFNGGNIGIETSALRNSGDNIDTGGVAFKLHDADGKFVELYRFFDPSGLQQGEIFSIEIAINSEEGYQGLDLRNSQNQTIFNFNGGAEAFTVNKTKSGDGVLDIDGSPRVLFHVEITQESDGEGSWLIRQFGHRSVLARGEFLGRVRSIRLYAGDQGSQAANALFFNRLEIQ
ncbi:hypothetical protein [Cerasicoccus arenae]|uniref:Uncharacterized protein n=1 Tax=Cerasicoccus arenae TaxID=424488 RepID=A0A8J3DJE9_9BACT|nr:hypothetical protein [Cerasicoccus arenae]MBK1858040.1 hypothetical protein [Cerasicoccus arenae]GHC06678.1 hypothetical protein GCM10007047_24630 [Cerasicoccus arenae]